MALTRVEPLLKTKTEFEGMRLSQEQIDRILALRIHAEFIKDGIHTERINSSADLIRAFEVALIQAKGAVKSMRALHTNLPLPKKRRFLWFSW